jgi:NADH dehydrogenase
LTSRIVIIGAGFGGLACARALRGAKARVTVVDRQNYHLFAPLLYQVATAALSPADIAVPVRRVLRGTENIEVMMAEVRGIDGNERLVRVDDGALPYDRLVIATGSVYNYYGHDDWAAAAPGVKTIGNARAIRASLLRDYELAESALKREASQRLMTTVIVGGGPTGVEMAGAVAELSRFALRRDFRHIRPETAHILLIEAGPRLLPAFPPHLSDYARRTLETMGVEVLLNTPVQAIEEGSLLAGDRNIVAGTIIWSAGIRASGPAEWLGLEPDPVGRLPVNRDLSVPGTDRIYLIGDAARFEQDGAPVPALAQVAQQQGTHLGRALARECHTGEPVPPFHFRNRGDVAVIGRRAAVYSLGRLQLKGRLAWFIWAVVHIYLLVGFDKRIQVTTQWVWRYFTFERGARLID